MISVCPGVLGGCQHWVVWSHIISIECDSWFYYRELQKVQRTFLLQMILTWHGSFARKCVGIGNPCRGLRPAISNIDAWSIISTTAYSRSIGENNIFVLAPSSYKSIRNNLPTISPPAYNYSNRLWALADFSRQQLSELWQTLLKLRDRKCQ